MEVDRPGPGEELNTGAATRPREAATVIVLRGGAETLEVLLVKRNPTQRFMGGAWVFPGGAVDADEDHRVAGRARGRPRRRAWSSPDPEALVEFSRWITPAQVKIRFDTHFYLAAAPAGAEPRARRRRRRSTSAGSRPTGALEAYERDEILLVFPTIKTLEQLAPFESAARAARVGGRPRGRADRAAGRRRGRGRARRAAGRAGLRGMSDELRRDDARRARRPRRPRRGAA